MCWVLCKFTINAQKCADLTKKEYTLKVKRAKDHTNRVRYNTKCEQTLKVCLNSTKLEDRMKGFDRKSSQNRANPSTTLRNHKKAK
jgi:hypothetical protein